MTRIKLHLTAVILFVISLFSVAAANVKLPNVIGSNMVLQREMAVPIWGWADPNENIEVRLCNIHASTKADANGNWMVRLAAMQAGGPYEMTIKGNSEITLNNIMVGEVWLCSGQSNMEMGLDIINNSDEEIAHANYPEIRLFDIPKRPAGMPVCDIKTSWVECSPKTVSSGAKEYPGGFSAAAYFFGRELHKELKVPVGLIEASWGGTMIEPWTPQIGFKLVPELNNIYENIARVNEDYKKIVFDSLNRIETWVQEARKALSCDKLPPRVPNWPQHPFTNYKQPTGLYNGIVHPVVPFAIRGAIWYQGESNRQDGPIYHEKMKALIGGWRNVWNEGDFPFYFVQIAPLSTTYKEDMLQKLWEAQTKSLSIPNTGMIVTTDIADLNDIHPKNKQDVGMRLALWALAKTYGRTDLVYSGPLYNSMSIEEGKIRINFNHTGSGLTTRDGKDPDWFEVAGKNELFVNAVAKIDGDTILVWNENVKSPVAVRFGWDQKAQPNLINKEGLPASPFRTDNW